VHPHTTPHLGITTKSSTTQLEVTKWYRHTKLCLLHKSNKTINISSNRQILSCIRCKTIQMAEVLKTKTHTEDQTTNRIPHPVLPTLTQPRACNTTNYTPNSWWKSRQLMLNPVQHPDRIRIKLASLPSKRIDSQISKARHRQRQVPQSRSNRCRLSSSKNSICKATVRAQPEALSPNPSHRIRMQIAIW